MPRSFGCKLFFNSDPTPVEVVASRLAVDGRVVSAGPAVAIATAAPSLAESGPFLAVGDIRIDNRAALIARLVSPCNAATDTQLLLAAYEAWGPDMLRRIEGEYAFVVIDRRKRCAFAARDIMGAKQLFYAATPAGIVFGSGLDMLQALEPNVSTEPNREMLADFTAREPQWHGWKERTALAGVHRLRAGAHLCAADGAVQTWAFDELLPDAGGARTESEFAERFHELFRASIRRRLHGIEQPGVLVSGGLDSSSIACQLAQDCEGDRPMPRLYSWIYPRGHSAHENSYSEAVAERCPAAVAVALRGESCWALESEISSGLMTAPETFLNPLLFERMAMRAVADGCDAVVTGEWGDEVVQSVGYGFPQVFAELTATDARAELAFYRRFCSMPRLGLEFIARWLLTGYRTARDEFRGLHVPVEIEGFAARQVWARVRGGTAALRTARLSRMGEDSGVDWPVPFLDRPLVSHLLAVPAILRQRRGRNKELLRIAMQGVLPESIRNRTVPANCNDINDQGIARSIDQIGLLLKTSVLVQSNVISSAQCLGLAKGLADPRLRADGWKAHLMRVVHAELWMRRAVGSQV